jgi:hypothetical protein
MIGGTDAAMLIETIDAEEAAAIDAITMMGGAVAEGGIDRVFIFSEFHFCCREFLTSHK